MIQIIHSMIPNKSIALLLFTLLLAGNSLAQDEPVATTTSKQSLREVPASNNSTEVRIETDGGDSVSANLFAGDLNRPTIIVIPESFEDTADWLDLSQPLINAGFTVLAVDLDPILTPAEPIDWAQATPIIDAWYEWLSEQGNPPNGILAECGDDETCRIATGLQPIQSALESIEPLTPTRPLPITPTPSQTPVPDEQDDIVTSTDIPQELAEQCTHRIESGDTLFELAIRYDTTVDALNAVNGLEEDEVLNIDQPILIPNCLEGTPLPSNTDTPTPETEPTFATPTPTATPVDGIIHVVESGDILQTIAAEYGVFVNDIIAANNLDNPDNLSIGQELIIPINQEETDEADE